MKNKSLLALTIAAVLTVTGCANSNNAIKETERLDQQKVDQSLKDSVDAARTMWESEQDHVTFIDRDSDLFVQKANEIPQGVLDKKLRAFSAKPGSTLGQLTGALRLYKVELMFGQDDAAKDSGIKDKTFAIKNYNGTLGELLSVIENLHNISFEYLGGSDKNGHMIVVRDTARYTVSIPQNENVVESLTETFETMGAQDIKMNLLAGSATYKATKTQQKDIQRYLDNFYENFAGVNLQLSVFTVSLDETMSQGFNWSEIEFVLGSINAATAGDVLGQMTQAAAGGVANGLSNAVGGATNGNTGTNTGVNSGVGTGTGTNTATNTGGTAGNNVNGQQGGATSLFDGSNLADTHSFTRVGGNGFSVGAYNKNLAVDAAIEWLNQYGSTRTTQSVFLGTVTGKETQIKTKKNVPYVSNVGTSFVGDSQPIASSNVETKNEEVGMEVKFLPYYESASSQLYIDLEVILKNLVGTSLVGDGQGTRFEQPEVQEQEFPTTLRMRAGETRLVGGIIFDTLIETRSEPSVAEAGEHEYIKQTLNKTAMFVLLRPTVERFRQSTKESGGK